MSATFQLRKAWGGWSLVSGINVPSRTTAIASNELYFYGISTSNSVNIANYPIGRSTNSSSALSCENWLYLYMTKAPSGVCNNFKFWGPNAALGAGLRMMLYATSFAKYHTASLSSPRCTLGAINYYQIGNALNLPTSQRASQVGSSIGYLVMQIQLASVAAIGEVTGDTCVYHYGYDES